LTGLGVFCAVEPEFEPVFGPDVDCVPMGYESHAVANKGEEASRLQERLEKAANVECYLAILDVNLDGERSYRIADALKQRSIPYMFPTG
jgi:CheY-like chemotaxis protein